MEEEYLTAEEAAALIGVKPPTIRNAMWEDRLPHIFKYGRRLLKRSDVLEYQARTQVNGLIARGRPRKQKAMVT